jgi:hypothetical protein
VLGLALLSAPALAADVASGANLTAMGGVGAAASRDNAAITLNPGLLALHPRYDFMGVFRYGPDPGASTPADLAWGVTAMDARTSKVVALGLAYSGNHYEPLLEEDDFPGWTVPGADIPNEKRFHDFAAALSFAGLDRRLGFGLGANVGLYDHDRQGDGVLFDLHAGLGARPVDWLVVGAAVRDFLPGGGQDRPLDVVGGVRFEAEKLFAVEVDADWRDDFAVGLPVTLASGFEARAGEGRVRLGWRRDASDGVHSVTAGLGWEQEGAAIEYGVQVPLDHPRLGSTIHAVSIRFGAPEPIQPDY